jgi:hypothetical protein
MECPNCRAEVAGKFCRWCGSAVSLPPNDAKPLSVCPACGASVRPGTKFCSTCATPLGSPAERAAVQASKECLHCGSQLKPGVRFCNTCGKPAPSADSGPGANRGWADVPTATAVDHAPVSSFSPPASSPPSWETSPFQATTAQSEMQTRSEIESPASAFETRSTPESLPEFEDHGVEPHIPATGSGFWANNKAILLTGVAFLGLAAGGLTYWFVLRKPAANTAPNRSSVTRPATAAPNKPSALEPATAPPDNSAAEPQPSAQTKEALATEPKKAAGEDPGGVSITVSTPVPGKSSDLPASTLPSAPASAPTPSLSGTWHGEYTNHDANQVTKVTLQISEDSADLLTGTLRFDPGGSNSASCAITGVYNPRSKFMLLKVGACQGHPPDYLQGKIGFSSVELSTHQVFGVDAAHNSLLNISRR